MKDAIILVLIIVGAFALVGWLSHLFQRRFNLQRNTMLPRFARGFPSARLTCACGTGAGRTGFTP